MADGSDVAAWLREAAVLADAGRTAEADDLLGRVLERDPANRDALLRRAGFARNAERTDKVLSVLEAAIRADPANPEWHLGHALTLIELNRHQAALAAFDRVIALQEDNAEAWFGKASLMLQFGRYKEGWELFEWRFYGTGAAVGARVFRQPPWDGQGFHGQMLLVHAEQGLGDTIQSYRFVPMARQLGGVTVEVPRPLARLFASQPNAPLVVPRGDPPPRFDLQCPMMTLPLVLGIELHSLPGAPYLVADPALGAAWRAKLPPLGDQMRVGIAWAGNPEHPNDRNRSVSLSVMLDMAGTGAMVVSLQQTVPDADQQTLREASHVIDPRAGLTDFAETAALIDQLDLVIAVDTSVAHLAGAMGKPVWILLPANADWRWLLERDDSPWYPSARLFRQDKPGDWAGVAARVRDALKEWPRRA